MLYDTHCHLDYLQNEGLILDDIIDDAKKCNVVLFNTICVELSQFPSVLSIANRYKNIYCSVGHHPCYMDSISNNSDAVLNDILSKASNDKVVGIGETGLDYGKNNEVELHVKHKQREIFDIHLEASSIVKKPIILHTRNAESDTNGAFLPYKDRISCVCHCFTGSIEFAKQMLDFGFYISFSGIITFKNANDLRDVVKYVPLDRILIETDAPYLAPDPHRGKTNKPKYVSKVAECISKVKEIPVEDVESSTFQNGLKVFQVDYCL